MEFRSIIDSPIPTNACHQRSWCFTSSLPCALCCARCQGLEAKAAQFGRTQTSLRRQVWIWPTVTCSAVKWNATSLLSIYNIIQYNIRTNWRIAVPISMFWGSKLQDLGEVLTCSFSSSDQQSLWRCLILTPHCDPWMKAETDIDYKTLREATLDTQLDFHILSSCCKDLHFLKLAQKLTISVFPGTENGWQSSFLSFWS